MHSKKSDWHFLHACTAVSFESVQFNPSIFASTFLGERPPGTDVLG